MLSGYSFGNGGLIPLSAQGSPLFRELPCQSHAIPVGTQPQGQIHMGYEGSVPITPLGTMVKGIPVSKLSVGAESSDKLVLQLVIVP